MKDTVLYYTIEPGIMFPPPPPYEPTTTATTARITWLPPPDPNGVITGYTVNLVAVSSLADPPSGQRKDVSFCVERLNAMVNRDIPVPADIMSLDLDNLGNTGDLIPVLSHTPLH